MDIRFLVIELLEKIGLIATAGLVTVLVPPLRNRLLGVGRPRDLVLAVIFGVLLSLWGAKMGFWWLDHHLNLRAIGIIIAGLLGGPRAGAMAGLLGGLFYVTRVEPAELSWTAVTAVLTSLSDGVLAGWVAGHRAQALAGWRALRTGVLIQLPGYVFVCIGIGLEGIGTLLGAWLPLLAQLAAVAAGAGLFVNVARVVLGREEQAVALVEARAAAHAQSLHALRSRLEPHFLFNALNTLRATIRRDPSRARDLVSDLADLYRYLLHHPEDASVLSEVEHARAYLAIEDARLGEGRLIVETAIHPDVASERVPALLLQPLVENAIHHGIAPKRGLGTVSIRASRTENHIRIEVEDHCAGEVGSDPPTRASFPVQGTGLALKTLRERLEKQYEDQASLELTPTEHGMLVTVMLPHNASIGSAA